MKRLTTMLAAAGVLAAATATPAWADFTVNPACGGNLFETCASVQLQSLDAHTIQVTVTNLNGESVYGAIGLINVPAGVTISSWTADVTQWTAAGGAATTNELNNFAGSQAVKVNNPAPANGLMGGATVVITFTLNSDLTAQQLADLGVGIHGISGPNGCSTKLGVTSGGVVQQGPYDPACMETVIPEPITMTLLATGLAGMGGAGFIRRRKKDDEIA